MTKDFGKVEVEDVVGCGFVVEGDIDDEEDVVTVVVEGLALSVAK